MKFSLIQNLIQLLPDLQRIVYANYEYTDFLLKCLFLVPLIKCSLEIDFYLHINYISRHDYVLHLET